ncbi:MAG: Rpn family recombination-promoting nuclease/putative transposase [Methylobacter sp.]|nr:Rpn family recombination-promoting nuclease/putative transposase [Methylobacter sp.]
MMKFVDPKTDIAFKKIFGNDAHKSILIEFLNEVLELEYPIEDVEISNTYQVPRLDGLKETSLDVKAKDIQGREFLVEMQVEKEAWFCQRAMYYSSKSYSQQLAIGQKYHLLKPVIFLGILDFKTFDHESPFSRHLILNAETGRHDLKDLEFNFIELPKFTKSEAELETVADKWIFFIKQATDLDHIPASADTPALRLAYEIAAQHRWTRDELEVYEAQELKLEKNRNVMVTAWMDGKNAGHMEGRVEGRVEGRMEGLIEGEHAKALAIARNLLSVMSDTDIAQATGLDEHVIAQLRSDAQ